MSAPSRIPARNETDTGAQGRERRTYRAPALTLHGSLKDLVRGGGSDVFDATFASGGGSFGPPLPPRPPD